jgi:uncharacterized phiE125 gp8 family phage protein
MKTELVTAPAQYPITLDEAKKQCEIGSETTHDVFIRSLIRAATGKAEQFLHRRLVSQTWKLYLDGWPAGDSFELPFGRLQSVTSIKYTDSDGDESTFSSDDYIVDTQSEPGAVKLGYQESWPTATLYPNNPIKIEFVCGFFLGDTWVLENAYSEDDLVMPTIENGLVYKCTTELTSSATAPTWPLTIAGTVADGAGATEGVWTCAGQAVPEAIRHAIKLTISDMFEYRETEYFGMGGRTLKTWEALLFPYKLWGGVF